MGCNQFVAHMAGFEKPEQLLGKTDFDLCWKEFAEDWRSLDLEVMQDNKQLKKEEIAKLADGKLITELTIKNPLYNKKNEIVGVIGISMDISEQKNLQKELIEAHQKAEAASQAKTEFLQNMRHDIRTPLTGIVGFADLLKSESKDPQIHEYSENLVASSHALLDLLDEVLEAIRVGSGEIPKLKKKFCLEQTLKQVIELNRARASEKKLSLTLDIDKAIPKYLIGDRVRLHRVALELVANALNFTDTGFVQLQASLARHAEGKIILKLVVEDSGIGIPKDKQQEIYLQFKRLTPSYQGIYKGAGLGLSVVKQFIDELGGEIYVKSEIRSGTCFTCYIPLQESLLDDASGIEEEQDLSDTLYKKTYTQQLMPSREMPYQHSFRVLIVEDNVIAHMVAKSILTKLDCDSDWADTGKKALQLWKNSSYDLIFMDIGLPDQNGYDVTHEIRIHELAKKSHCPIIALTAHAGDENKQRCIEAGMNAVLTKPLSTKSCKDILETFIPGYRFPEDTSNSELPEQDMSPFDLVDFPALNVQEGIKTIGSETILAEMLTIITQSLPEDLELMIEGHKVEDWDKIQQLAHKIKGGAVYVGTIKLKMACQYLERYWKSGQREFLEPLFHQLIKVINESLLEINLWLTKTKT